MSKQLKCEVLSLEHECIFVGLKTMMNEESMFKEAGMLANAYAKIKRQIKHVCLPVHTAIITGTKDPCGNFLYFMGDEVTVKNNVKEPLVQLTLPKGTLLARVSVKAGSQLTLSYKVANLRKRFYTEWLKDHGYASVPPYEDMEYYHYRKRRFRKATKMVMELYFFIQKQD